MGATAAAATASTVLPHIWVPNKADAATAARGEVKHLLYIRLAGGFRFTSAFNGDVAPEYNPFGMADNVADGVEWGVGKLLQDAPFLEGEDGAPLRDRGVQSIPEIADDIAVLPCVDHEPFSARADGNHGTGLERFQKGYVGEGTSFFTMINYGLRQQYQQARENGETPLPAFSLGDPGMAVGAGGLPQSGQLRHALGRKERPAPAHRRTQPTDLRTPVRPQGHATPRQRKLLGQHPRRPGQRIRTHRARIEVQFRRRQ